MGKLHYQAQGNGAPVVLVHGFLCNGDVFEGLAKRLASHFHVISIDLPGFGGSLKQPIPATVEHQMEQVFETIASLNLGPFSILGHSLGAMIALEMSITYPDAVDKLILYGGCPDGLLPDRFETTEDSIRLIQSQGMKQTAYNIAAQWFWDKEKSSAYPKTKAMVENVDEEACIAHLKTWDAWKARHRLGQVKAKTLIICGDQDRSTHPDLSVEMWHKINRSHLFILPNAGHAAHLEYPDLFEQTVGQFLNPGQ